MRAILPWLVVASFCVGRALAGAYPAPGGDGATSLLRTYVRLHPERAVGPEVAPGFSLEPLGPLSMEWARDLRAGLRRLEYAAHDPRPGASFVRLRAMASWVESELILAEALAPARTDPAAYIDHALAVFESLRDAAGVERAERREAWERCLGQLPAYLEDSRRHLLDPTPLAVERALEQLGTLEQLLARPWAPERTPDRAEGRVEEGGGEDPASAIARHRRWLREVRERVAGEPRRLGAEWERFVQLATGTSLSARQVKALLLRDLAGASEGYPVVATSRRALRSIPRASLQHGVENPSANALTLARWLEILGPGPGPDALRVTARESAPGETRTAIGTVASRDEEWLVLQLPSPAWSGDRTGERWMELLPRPLAALSLRHGMVGEALFSIAARSSPHAFTSTVLRRPLAEGFGLFALDWVPEIQHEHNPFLGDADLARAIGQVRGLETARLLATLELHDEGLSFEAALVGFLRRTEVTPDRARAEVTQALLDPAYGLGALVRHELLDLEGRLERLLGPQKALPRLLRLVLENPDLCPSDLPDAL